MIKYSKQNNKDVLNWKKVVNCKLLKDINAI